jgi:hypothetical protein
MRRTILILFVVFCSIVNNFTVVSAEEGNDMTVFSFEKDGYWEPSDSISHNFTIKNIWGKSCYLDYITLNKNYIIDVKTLREYSIDQAIENGIINDYNVVICLNDANEGNDILFDGSMKELENYKIQLKKKIFMEQNTTVTFNIKISFDKLAKNQYQNKSYQYIIEPSAYQVIPSEKNETKNKIEQLSNFGLFFKTSDGNMLLGFIAITLLIGSFFIVIKIKKT